MKDEYKKLILGPMVWILLFGGAGILFVGKKFFPQQSGLIGSVLTLIFSFYFLAIGIFLLVSEDFRYFYYFKPMRYSSLAGLFGNDYQAGKWSIMWIYIPLNLTIGMVAMVMSVFRIFRPDLFI